MKIWCCVTYGRASDTATDGGDPMACKPHGAAQAATKDERKATQLAECMQLLAEYFCCCAALRRGRRSRLDNKPRRQAQVCWLQDSGRRLTRRVCLNRAATDRASVRAAGERWRQSDVEQHGAMNRNCATAGKPKVRAFSPRRIGGCALMPADKQCRQSWTEPRIDIVRPSVLCVSGRVN